MRSDIERYLAGRPVQAPVPVPEPDPEYPTRATVVAAPPTESTSVRNGQPVPPADDERRTPRTGLLVLLGLLVVALIVGAVLAFGSDLFESAPEQEQVPNLIGLTEDEARIASARPGSTVGEVDYEPSETVDKDAVIEQDPNRDQYVDPGTEVDLVVSTGKPMVQVPFVVGQTKTEARNQLRNAKLEVTFETEESDKPKGEVVRTRPAGGETVQQGNTVTVFVSDGQEKVPNVIGMQQGEAEERIRDAKFDPQVRDDNASTEPAGTVTDQFPVDGTLAEGSTVIIFVSVYVEPPPPTDGDADRPPRPTSPLSRRPGSAQRPARRRGRAGRRTPAR